MLDLISVIARGGKDAIDQADLVGVEIVQAVDHVSATAWQACIGEPSFEDGTGHVIGHFVADQAVAGEAGVRPYIFVERVDETLDKVVAQGGAIVRLPYPEGDLWVATFRDPSGNVIGVWQQGPR